MTIVSLYTRSPSSVSLGKNITWNELSLVYVRKYNNRWVDNRQMCRCSRVHGSGMACFVFGKPDKAPMHMSLCFSFLIYITLYLWKNRVCQGEIEHQHCFIHTWLNIFRVFAAIFCCLFLCFVIYSETDTILHAECFARSHMLLTIFRLRSARKPFIYAIIMCKYTLMYFIIIYSTKCMHHLFFSYTLFFFFPKNYDIRWFIWRFCASLFHLDKKKAEYFLTIQLQWQWHALRWKKCAVECMQSRIRKNGWVQRRWSVLIRMHMMPVWAVNKKELGFVHFYRLIK